MPRNGSGSGAGFSAAFSSWFRENVNQMTSDITQAVEDAVEAGDNITKHHIETRGTAKSGKRGRVETGAMRDAVTHRMDKKTALEVSGRFGWLSEKPEYAQYQEPGFEHRGGVTVEGMFALSDAAEEVITDLEADITKIVRNS